MPYLVTCHSSVPWSFYELVETSDSIVLGTHLSVLSRSGTCGNLFTLKNEAKVSHALSCYYYFSLLVMP